MCVFTLLTQQTGGHVAPVADLFSAIDQTMVQVKFDSDATLVSADQHLLLPDRAETAIGDEAAKQQSASTAEVKLALRSVSPTTEANAASAEGMAASAEQLNAQAQKLRDLVLQLRIS